MMLYHPHLARLTVDSYHRRGSVGLQWSNSSGRARLWYRHSISGCLSPHLLGTTHCFCSCSTADLSWLTGPTLVGILSTSGAGKRGHRR
jgi:hypothetical protein